MRFSIDFQLSKNYVPGWNFNLVSAKNVLFKSSYTKKKKNIIPDEISSDQSLIEKLFVS